MTMGRPFWVPEALPEREGRYRLVASEAACVGIPGRRAPRGGVTTAAAIDAREQATGCALHWASSQFVSAAPTDTDFEIEVELVAGGRQVQRVRATLQDGEREILVAAGALGAPDPPGGEAFVAMPSVPSPGACRRLDAPSGTGTDLFQQFDRRLALRDEAAGRELVWFRSVDAHPVSAGLLAILGDFVAGAHPHTRGSIGFDNTLRVVARPETEWVLAEAAIAHIGERIVHGGMQLFAESGELLALTSLTALRPRPRKAAGSPEAGLR